MFMYDPPVSIKSFQEHPNLLFSQAHILTEVEQVVNMIVQEYSLSRNAKALEKDKLIFNDLFYQKLLWSLNRYLAVYQPHYIYSEHYNALLYACEQTNIIGFIDGMLYRYPVDIYQVYKLVTYIACYAKTVAFTRKVGDRYQRQQENYRRISSFAQAMHQAYARLLVCRIDLSYLHACQHLVTIETVMGHLQQLLAMMSGYTGLFKYLKAYIWAIEQGIDKGFHIHLLTYFDGREHQQDWFMADQIGQLWHTITANAGYFYNGNTEIAKQKYKAQGTCGLGMIYRDDINACTNAVNVACYLAKLEKDDQYLRGKPQQYRAMGMSQLPHWIKHLRE